MKDFIGNASGSVESGTSTGERAPGKTTLSGALRGLAPASSGPAAAPTVSPLFDFTFSDAPGRGLGGDGEKQILRGGEGDGDGSTAIGGGDGGTPMSGAPKQPVAPVTIGVTTNAGPTFGPEGASMWHVAFTTSGRTGWIVQEITNTINATDNGTAMTMAGIGLAPHYYEAWSVSATGAVTPMVSGDNDHWDGPGLGPRTKGTWTTLGDLYWIAGSATPGGMAARTVPNAGMLVSSFTAPPGLGSVLRHRSMTATWDATATPPTHTGTTS